MLALLRTRPPPHASPSAYARTLRTRPHLIPSYIKTWDPTYPVSVWQSGKLVDEKSQAQEGETDIRPTQEEIHEPNLVRSVEWDTQDRKPIHLGFSHRDRRLSYLLVLYESERENERLRAPLWRAYQLAKRYNKTLLHRLTDRAWQLLFSSRSAQVMGGQREKSQLSQLHRDMHKGRLTIPQRIQRIEYLFGHGLPKLALQEWSDFRNTESDYLKLGVKLYALAGFPGEARATMEELYQLYPTYDPSVMMLVFRAFTGSIVNQDRRDAGGIYLKMKKRLGDRVTIENYDSWLVGFLESGRLIDAKQVFKHMVKDGYVDVEGSAQAVTEVLKRFHMLCRLGTDISRMTNIALTAISVLPTAYHGHIFGHWMHIAVNYRAPEAVAQIFDMMVQRNSAPSTYHFNMLLRSLFRTKEDPHTMKAENIAWHMIDEARKIGPKIQASSMSAAEFIRANIVEATDQPMKLAGTPKADVNTFALLIQHHGKSSQWEHVDYLYRQLKILSFEPNAAIMNVLMDNKIRQGAYVEAWSMYKSFTEPEPGYEGVYPDGASIRMVWKNLRLALGDSATRDLPGLPSPRELLQETNDWRNLHKARHDQNRFRQGLAAADNGAITALMMHCFSYKQDVPGSLIALHILRQKFSIFPTVKAQEILMKQMAWVDLSLESSSITTQYYHSKSNARTLAHIIKIYDAIKEAREKRLLDAGINRSLMTKEHLGDEYLNLLSEFTRFMLKRQYGSEYAEDMILAAKCSVGAPELTTGDVNAWEIP